MAAARPLRAVKAGESKAATTKRRPAVKSVTQAVANGTERELLVAMRAVVAKAVEAPNTSTRDLAALTRRLLEIDRDIRALDAREKQEAEDDASQVEDGDFDASAV